MTAQHHADQLLGLWQAHRHLSPVLRSRAIDAAILQVANANSAPTDALFDAQLAAMHGAIGAEKRA